MSVAAERVEPVRRTLQGLGCYVCVPLDHRASFPAAEPLKLMGRCPRLTMPSCKGVPQVMPLEVINARSVGADLNLTQTAEALAICKHIAGVKFSGNNVCQERLFWMHCFPMTDQPRLQHDTARLNGSVLERQLLLQLGDRLKRLRQAQGLGTVEMAERVGVSRPTLRAVEAGDPGPSMGTYLRVMSVLGVAGDLALLSGDILQPLPQGSAAARSRRSRPQVRVTVTADEAGHRAQDLQSLALHEQAVRLVRADPELVQQAQDTLQRWLSAGDSRSSGLWREWQDILLHRSWRKVLGRTRRAQELRQASPLVTLLPADVRRAVLSQVRALKKGVTLGDPEHTEMT